MGEKPTVHKELIIHCLNWKLNIFWYCSISICCWFQWCLLFVGLTFVWYPIFLSHTWVFVTKQTKISHYYHGNMLQMQMHQIRVPYVCIKKYFPTVLLLYIMCCMYLIMKKDFYSFGFTVLHDPKFKSSLSSLDAMLKGTDDCALCMSWCFQSDQLPGFCCVSLDILCLEVSILAVISQTKRILIVFSKFFFYYEARLC